MSGLFPNPLAPNAYTDVSQAAQNAALAASGGALSIGYLPGGVGAVAITSQAKLRQRVSVLDFGAVGDGVADDTAAIQAAINSGARRVVIGVVCKVTAPINLAATQIVDFNGGSLITSAGIAAPNGVLYGNGVANLKIIDPVIDASATTGVSGIWLANCLNAKIDGGLLTKCCLVIAGALNTTPINNTVRGTIIDMAGWQSTAVFVTAAYKVSLSDITCFHGIEGIGLYGASRQIKHANCESWGHTRDGFVVIDAQRVSYTGCLSYGNTQSGFTTQRLTAGSQAVFISYANCQSYDNTADGFDVRGAPDPGPIYGVNMHATFASCIAFNNGATGWYIVWAEGVSLTGCTAMGNQAQGYFANGSPRTLLTGCRSVSNANLTAAGTAKAGIFFQDSPNSGAVGCDSENSNGVTQQFGISLTGTSNDCWITGGNYLNNSGAPANLNASDVGAYVCGAAVQSIANIYPDTITAHTGVYSETGLGVPVHVRAKASLFRRLDSGGGGEVYISNGGGGWTLK